MEILGDLFVRGKIKQGKSDVTAIGLLSHVEGSGSTANGDYSLIHGNDSVANGNHTIVLGRNITGNTDDTTYVDNLNIDTPPQSASTNYNVLVRDISTGDIKQVSPNNFSGGTGGSSITNQTLLYRTSGITGVYEYISSIPGVSHPTYDLGYYIDNNLTIVQMNYTSLNVNINSSLIIPIEFRVHDSNNNSGFGPAVTSGTLIHTENISITTTGTRWNETRIIPLSIDLSSYAGKHLTINVGNYVLGTNVVTDTLVKLFIG